MQAIGFTNKLDREHSNLASLEFNTGQAAIFTSSTTYATVVALFWNMTAFLLLGFGIPSYVAKDPNIETYIVSHLSKWRGLD